MQVKLGLYIYLKEYLCYTNVNNMTNEFTTTIIIFFFQKRKILKTNYKSKIDFVMKQNGIKINVI